MHLAGMVYAGDMGVLDCNGGDICRPWLLHDHQRVLGASGGRLLLCTRSWSVSPLSTRRALVTGNILALPDIVICPFNRFNRSFLEAMNVSAGLAQYLELSYPSPVIHNFQQDTYQHTIRNIDLYEYELEELLLRIGNLSFTEFIRRVFASIDFDSSP
jgi:hypothetical protein